MFFIASKDVLNATCEAPTDAFKAATIELHPLDGYRFKNAPIVQAVDATGVFISIPLKPDAQGSYSIVIDETTYLELGYPDDRLCSLDIIAAASLDGTQIRPFGLVRIYELSQDQLDTLSQAVWVTLDNEPTQVKLSEHIHSLINLRAPLEQQQNLTHLKLGEINTGLVANQIVSPIVTTDCGSIEIEGVYGNALDYSNVSLELYLPFHGIESLDPSKVMNSTIHLSYETNVMTGLSTITIKDSLGLVLYTYNANCSYPIPLKTSDSTRVTSLEITPCYAASTTPTLTLRYNRPCYIDGINNSSERHVLKDLVGTGFVECHNPQGWEQLNLSPTLQELLTSELSTGVYL